MADRTTRQIQRLLAAIALTALALTLALAGLVSAIRPPAPPPGTEASPPPPTADPTPETAGEPTPPTTPPPRAAAPVSPPLRLDQLTLAGQPVPIGSNSTDGIQTVVVVSRGNRGLIAEVEIKPTGQEFDGGGLRAQAIGTDATGLIAHPLADGAYRWRARLRDGITTTAWQDFAPNAPRHFVVLSKARAGARPEVPPTLPQTGPGAASSDSSGGGGPARPLPSFVDPLPTLWDQLEPILQVLAALGALTVVVGVAAWLIRRHHHQGPGAA